MARLDPVAPPYSDEVQASFDKLMPPGMEPLRLFRTLAHNPRVLRRIQRGGLLDPGSITVRLRELVILRTCALCGAEYEWAVHVAAFAAAAGLSAQQLAALGASESDGLDRHAWAQHERAALALVESLHASARVDDSTWARAAEHFSPAQLIELVTLTGLYHAVAFLVNATGVEAEDWAA